MNKLSIPLTGIALIVIVLFSIFSMGCKQSSKTADEAAAPANESQQADFERGPHHGRLLRDGDFAAEITIFENGVPPQFRVYITQRDKAVAANSVALTIQLQRFGGVVDTHRFSARDNYLVSDAEVYEPHSFIVAVSAEYQGRIHHWSYNSFEDRTVIDAAMAAANAIETASAGPGTIKESITLYGAIQPDATKLRAVVARFPGVIRSVDVAIGAQVRAGQILASIESNESLQTYAITAPIAGVVLQRHANPGETSGSEPLFEIGDYSQLWAVLNIFPRERARLHSGQSTIVRASDGSTSAAGSIAAINAAPASTSAALTARVVLDNREQQWTPGQFIAAEAVIAEIQVPIAVPIAALQTLRDMPVVFMNSGDSYQAQPVQLGRRDNDRIEITGGLAAGTTIVVRNSYLLKADIEKSGASHDH